MHDDIVVRRRRISRGERGKISADELENMLMAFMGIYAISRVLMNEKYWGTIFPSIHEYKVQSCIVNKSISKNIRIIIIIFLCCLLVWSLINAARLKEN